MNWYYAVEGKQAGPVDDAQLDALAGSGQIQGDTLVWREGMATWEPYRNVRPSVPTAAAPPPSSAAGAGPRPGVGEAVCAECGRIFPADEMIQHGNVRICAGCKPIFMQKLAEGASVAGSLTYATIGARFGAVVLDGILLFAVNMAMNFAAGLGMSPPEQPTPGNVALRLIVFFVQMGIGITYEVFMLGKYGATLGKMAVKVRVVTPEGGKISYGRAFGRYFAKLLSSLICLVGYIMAFFDPERRALHDRICNTRVIKVG